MRKMLGGLAALLMVGIASTASAAPDPRRASLDRLVPRLLAEHKVPSASVAHVEDGRIVLLAAYGEQSPGVPATTDTLYNVASLTKPISAETVLRLASQGGLSLDEPMHPHWVDPDLAADPRHRLLTPRVALSHRTGFPNWRRMAADKRLAFRTGPGEKPGYSGEGYEYFARFTERKAGEPFEALAQRLVFDPIGMSRTSYTGRPWFEGRLATGVNEEGKPQEHSIRTAFVASDDMVTSPADYARFLISSMKREGLTPAIARERETVQASTRETSCAGARANGCPDEIGFGLGWEVLKFPDRTMMMHSGNDSGEFTIAWFSPDTRDGTVIFTNKHDGYKIVVEVAEALGMEPAFMRFLRSQAAPR